MQTQTMWLKKSTAICRLKCYLSFTHRIAGSGSRCRPVHLKYPVSSDLPNHGIDRSQAEKAAAPLGLSAEQSAVESVDQTGKVKATKRHLPIDAVVIDENTQSKCPRGNKSTSYASSLQGDQSFAKGDNDPDSLWSPNSYIGNLVRNLIHC